jgi:chemotaxis protein MotB
MSADKSDQLLIQPIIIVKKIIHGGHHGGAWKVAYADFVTAMMALFIVLWLLSSSAEVKKAVGGYFRDPSGKSAQNGSGQSGSSANIGIGKDDMGKLKEKLEAAIREAPDVGKLKDQVLMSVTGEGLRIELLESKTNSFFETGNALPTATGEEMLRLLAAQLGKLPNTLSVEGHTDANPYVSTTGYSNWELSSDRANAARKLIQQFGVGPAQVADVRGYAAQKLRKPEDPTSASNRRVSIVVKYRTPDDAPVNAIAGKPTPGGEAKPGAGNPSQPPSTTPAKAAAAPVPDNAPAKATAEKPTPVGEAKPAGKPSPPPSTTPAKTAQVSAKK